jgi:hypothetical protein
MPQFILDTSGAVTTEGSDANTRPVTFDRLDPFTQGYIEALFFTEEESLCEESDGARRMPDVAINTATMESRFVGGDSFGFADLAPETLARIIADCAAFRETLDWRAFVADRNGNHASDEQAGHDFWLTRNGHGTGFWDRPESYYGAHQVALDAAAKAAKSVDVYLGDDGKVYLS